MTRTVGSAAEAQPRPGEGPPAPLPDRTCRDPHGVAGDGRRSAPSNAAAPPGRPLTPAVARLLRDVARFGYLTAGQAAAMQGVGSVAYARRRLEERGWLTARTLVGGPGLGLLRVYQLTPAGRRAAVLLPAAPRLPRRVVPDRVDVVLSAAGLAVELERSGAGIWRTWAEHVAAAGGLGPRTRPPCGLLRTGDGCLVPMWIVLWPEGLSLLRRGMDELRPRLRRGRPEVRALPPLCPWLAAELGLAVEVVPWTPPHLAARGPLAPGWHRRPWVRAGGAEPVPGRRTEAPGPRGLAVLRFLDRFGYATCGQIERAGACADRRWAADVLRRLEDLGLAQRCRPQPASGRPKGGLLPHVWSASAAGLAAIGSRRQPVPAVPRRLRHTLALVDVAVQLQGETGGRWEAERELGADVRTKVAAEPGAVPDGRLTLPGGRRVLVQLQLTGGHPDRQLRNAWTQRRLGLGDEVWFLCAPEVAGRYRASLQPAEAAFIRVREWRPPPGEAVLLERAPRWYPRWEPGAARRGPRTDGTGRDP